MQSFYSFAAQLNQIRQTSMARLICDNTNINEVQPLAFRQANSDM